jgi:modification methylase
VYSWAAVESAVWWVTFVFRGSAAGVTFSYHFTRISRSAPVSSVSIAYSRSYGTRSRTGATEAEGNGAGFYGKPYQPGGIVKNDIEYILFLRKGGEYRTTPALQKALSMMTKQEMKTWFRSIWSDVRGASTRDGHPAPYPIEVAERLIKMFSFAGDTVLDPFAGTGSTSQAAIMSGRNSIANEIEAAYVDIARQRITKAARQHRLVGAIEAEAIFDGDARATRIPVTNRIQATL